MIPQEAPARVSAVIAVVQKHRRHVELSPGVGADLQRYALAVLDDVLDDLQAALIASPETPEQEKTERRIREYLWLSHGHQGMYGDDGEMQCGMCVKFGMFDYKREPLSKLIEAVDRVCRERLAETFANAPLPQPPVLPGDPS